MVVQFTSHPTMRKSRGGRHCVAPASMEVKIANKCAVSSFDSPLRPCAPTDLHVGATPPTTGSALARLSTLISPVGRTGRKYDQLVSDCADCMSDCWRQSLLHAPRRIAEVGCGTSSPKEEIRHPHTGGGADGIPCSPCKVLDHVEKAIKFSVWSKKRCPLSGHRRTRLWRTWHKMQAMTYGPTIFCTCPAFVAVAPAPAVRRRRRRGRGAEVEWRRGEGGDGVEWWWGRGRRACEWGSQLAIAPCFQPVT